MNQEIHFKGLSLTPDDHHTQPGELSACANVELHNGALRPSVINGTYITDKLIINGKVAQLLHVHTVSKYTFFIGSVKTGSSTKLYWFNEDGSHINDNLIHTFDGEVKSVQTVGNSLVIVAADGIHYARLLNGKYTYIGSKMPELEMSFALDIEMPKLNFYDSDSHHTQGDMKELFMFNDAGWSYNGKAVGLYTDSSYGYTPGTCTTNRELDEEDTRNSAVTDTVLAEVNEYINKHQKDGKFLFPFFVRYAYRLYDGSNVMHSAPILMPCGSGTPYVITPWPLTDSSALSSSDSSRLRCGFFVIAPLYSLKCKLSSDITAQLENWSDVITGVDIYISQPFYRYDASGKVKGITCIGTADRSYVADVRYAPFHDAYAVGSIDNNNVYQHYDVSYLMQYYKAAANEPYSYWSGDTKWLITLPLKDEEEYNKEIRNCSEFFLLKSLEVAELPTEFTLLEVREGYLNTITAQKQMKDDYGTHDIIVAQQAYTYNNRLNITNITKKQFEGYKPTGQYTYISATGTQTIGYFIKQECRDFFVVLTEENSHAALDKPYIFFPNPAAYMAIISVNGIYKKVALKEHASLNGAVYFKDVYEKMPGTEIAYSEVESLVNTASHDTAFSVPNKIYTSEIDNPYYFPLDGIVTVGLGSIIGMAGITRALSPGQMGVHKMMVFCTDGIWALKVGDLGTFSTTDRISFDNCVNKDTICQLGQSVLFATNAGVSRVDESDVTSVTDKLDGPEFDINALPGLVTTITSYLGNGYLTENGKPSLGEHPLDFLKTARLIYDFSNHRVIAFSHSPQRDIAMVLSSDQTWSVLYTPNILACVNSYPYNYIQLTNGQLIRLDKNYDYSNVNTTASLIITRSLSWSSTMQVIQGFQQIHNSAQPALLVFYGSNDNRTWWYIGKSERAHAPYLPGHPFRYFRVAILMRMNQSETYSKLILDVKDKYEKL